MTKTKIVNITKEKGSGGNKLKIWEEVAESASDSSSTAVQGWPESVRKSGKSPSNPSFKNVDLNEAEQIDFENYKSKVASKPSMSRSLNLSNKSQKLDLPNHLHTSLSEDMNTTKRKKKKKKGKLLKKILIAFFILIFALGIASYVFIYIPAKKIQNSANNVMNSFSAISSDLEDKNITNLESNIQDIRDELESINKELGKFDILADLSSTKGYYENLSKLRNVVEKTDVLVEDSLPDLINVLEETGFTTNGNAKKVVQAEIEIVDGEEVVEEPSAMSLIMSELPLYIDLYKEKEPLILDILEEIDSIDPEYVPEVAGLELNDKLNKFKDVYAEYPNTSTQTLDFLEQMPELIGSSKKTSYLVILQNETEMRASGGLLTAFGTMVLENGEFNGDIALSDMWNLEIYVSYTLGIDVGYRNIYGQNYLMNTGCGSTYLRAQDAGIYPDLNWTMDTFTDYYDIANEYNPIEYPPYDHVLILDNNFAESILSLIQPLEVEGYGEVSAENLFDFIKQETDKPELSYSPERKAIIKEIANTAKEKFIDLELAEVPNIVRVMVDSFNAKDIALYSKQNELQEYFDKYGMSGRTENEFDGDYFHLNEAQNCSLKLNKFVRDTVTQSINIDESGEITKDVNVKWEQPQIYNEALKLQYSPTDAFSYRAWIRIFAPPETVEFDSDGYQKSGYLGYYPQEYLDEVENKAVSDNIIQFDHRRFSEDESIPSKELNVSYKLPEDLNFNDKKVYKLLIQKHPGKSWGEEYVININHSGKSYNVEFTLDRDKIVTYRNGIITVDNYQDKLDWATQMAESIF